MASSTWMADDTSRKLMPSYLLKNTTTFPVELIVTAWPITEGRAGIPMDTRIIRHDGVDLHVAHLASFADTAERYQHPLLVFLHRHGLEEMLVQCFGGNGHFEPPITGVGIFTVLLADKPGNVLHCEAIARLGLVVLGRDPFMRPVENRLDIELTIGMVQLDKA